jgi:alpha-galactosidase/6-phospho-beta-glucosidase family protein
VVELFGCLDAAGAHIDPVPPRPPAVRALVARLAAAEDLLYRAAAGRDRELLAGALDALPLPWTDAARSAARADLLDCICLPPSSIPDIGSRR